MANILLLEDNTSLGKSLVERLGQEGYRLEWAQTVEQATAIAKSNTSDLAIVDVSLPDGNGIDFAKNFLKPLGIPVLFLSAFSSAEYRLEGFDAGAVDYIPKPFHLRELLIRVKRALEASKKNSVIDLGEVQINLDSQSLTDKKGESRFLPPRDFALLKLLIECKPKVVSREEILKKIWADEGASNFRTIDNAIVRVRQALGTAAGGCIRSVRGIGYQWVENGI
jgi:DNA-binding response OmpR family regulator